MMDEDWNLVLSFFPKEWREYALRTNALKGLRKDKSPDNILKTMMIHFSCGYSLRETAIRAKKAHLADLSDVALLKRLQKSKDWLYMLCTTLFKERGVCVECDDSPKFRLFDATNVKEPGKTGSLWRIHYSISVPSLECDYFKITPTKGNNVHEDFSQYPIYKDDYIIADRGYSKAKGIYHVSSQGAYVCVRVNTRSLKLIDKSGDSFPLMERLCNLDVPGKIGNWTAAVLLSNGEKVFGRLCALRKSEEAICLAHKKLRRQESKKGYKLEPETLFFAQYVILFTTFPETSFTPEKILEWYRVRWQIELVFKRFKQIAQLGHLPKYDDESSKAWLYGKLLVALLTEKIIHYAEAISPWGYLLE